jgi:hypothetical protein
MARLLELGAGASAPARLPGLKAQPPIGLTLLLAALALAPACGYGLAGRLNALPEHIRKIGVPQFINQTEIPDLDVKFSEEVRAEFRSRRKYRVEPTDKDVDAVMIGKITAVHKNPSAFDSNSGQATRYTITVVVAVEFKDLRDNKVHYSNPAESTDDQFPVSSGANADLGAFFRQNTGALDRIAKQFARSVVSSILEAF